MMFVVFYEAPYGDGSEPMAVSATRDGAIVEAERLGKNGIGATLQLRTHRELEHAADPRRVAAVTVHRKEPNSSGGVDEVLWAYSVYAVPVA